MLFRSLEIEAFYKNGKLEGLRRDYYKSGKLEVKGLQKNGKPDGWTYVYNEDGSLKREIFFVEECSKCLLFYKKK